MEIIRLEKIVATIALIGGLVAAGMVLSSAGSARAAGMCTDMWKPVCGSINGWKRTFSNACWAKNSGAKILYKGVCKW